MTVGLALQLLALALTLDMLRMVLRAREEFATTHGFSAALFFIGCLLILRTNNIVGTAYPPYFGRTEIGIGMHIHHAIQLTTTSALWVWCKVDLPGTARTVIHLLESSRQRRESLKPTAFPAHSCVGSGEALPKQRSHV